MTDSPSVYNTVLDHLIIRKEIRSDFITRLRARERMEPMDIRTNLYNRLSEANSESPLILELCKDFLEEEDFPSHIALTPDGNRRFAWARGKPVGFGYQEGSKRLEDFRRWAMIDNSVDFISIFTLSTENIERRPEDELEQLFAVFADFFNRVAEDPEVKQNRIRHEVRGNRQAMEKLPSKVREAIQNMEEATSDFTDKQVTILMPYGSRDDIIRAARQTSTPVTNNIKVTGEGEDSSEFRENLVIGDLPDVDLMIRTSEQRLSNFLLYENAYSEFVFLQKTWPNFSESDFYESIYRYSQRDRRFGV